MQTPKEKHPIFYGCFDWHSAVHGHWLMASALNRFPGTELSDKIEKIFDSQFEVNNLFYFPYNRLYTKILYICTVS